jgi:hypothetical protein
VSITATVLAPALDEALDSAATVTVVLYDGTAHTGIVAAHPRLSNGVLLVIPVTATREQPAQFHRDDVVGVIFE